MSKAEKTHKSRRLTVVYTRRPKLSSSDQAFSASAIASVGTGGKPKNQKPRCWTFNLTSITAFLERLQVGMTVLAHFEEEEIVVRFANGDQIGKAPNSIAVIINRERLSVGFDALFGQVISVRDGLISVKVCVE